MRVAAGTPRYENEASSLEVFGCHWCHPLPFGFRPCIGVRGVLSIAGITMALRRPHKRMKMVVRRAVQRARTSGPP